VRRRTAFIGILCVVFIILSAAASLSPARAQTQASVRMAVEVGFEGRFRDNRWTPVLIRVANDGPNIDGELRIVSGGGLRLNTGGYSTPIQLPTQSSKQVFLYIALEAFTAQVQVELVNREGVIIQNAAANATRLNPAELLFGVITEAPTGTLDLGSRSNADPVQVNLSIDSLPPLAQGLEALDLLIFSDVDTGKLSLERRRAVEDWVLAGGHLIVTGGPNWQKTRSGFDTFLPITGGTTVTLNKLDKLAAYTGYGNAALESANGIVVATGGTTQGAQVLIEQDGTPLLTRRNYGLGMVDYLSIDPGLEPFRTWVDRPALWQTMVSTQVNKPGWARGIADGQEAVSAINYTRGLRLPDVAQLIAFLAIYILLIGPLNYLILRAIRKPELAWFTIPAIIVVTSVAAYAVGSNLRGTLPTLSRMNLVQQWPDQDRARLDGVTGLIVPRRGDYSVEADEGVIIRSLGGSNASSIRIEEGTRFAANRIAVDTGISANFMVSAYINPIALNGDAQITFKRDNVLTVTGEVRNESQIALADAVVFCANQSFPLGTLEPGASKKFSYDVDIAEFAAPSLLTGRTGTSIAAIRGMVGYRYPGDTSPAQIFTSGVSTVRRNETPAEINERRRREFFARAMTDENERGTGRALEVFVAGWSTTSPVIVSMKDTTNFNAEDLTLYLIKLDSTITPRTGTTIRYSPAFTVWSALDRSILRDYAPYGLYVIGNDEAAFRYSPSPALGLASVSGFVLNLQRENNNANSAIISLWDWQTAEWVDLPSGSIGRGSTVEFSGESAKRYLAPDMTVRVKIRAPNGSASYDRVDVSYIG
jgi:hypothetical protein